MNKDSNILVAIYCIVYNHEPYLRDCIEGFVMQKTNFRFVAVVHDDVSTDNSAAIIREYAEKYPDIIKPIFETENQWSKHDGSLDRIMSDAIAATGAKYIAMCEGDDYWTDPLKLQKQVDFLESHPDYSICCHGYSLLNQNEESIKEVECPLNINGEGMTFTNVDNWNHWYTKTLTILFRADKYYEMPDMSQFQYWRDAHIDYYLLKLGKGFYLPFNGGVYREHQGGVYYALSSLRKELINIRVYNDIYTHNQNDNDLADFLDQKIKDVENELVWMFRDENLTTELIRAKREISRILWKHSKYRHLLKWRGLILQSTLNRIKRCNWYKLMRTKYYQIAKK